MNLHDFVMKGLKDVRGNINYSKADVMYLALCFLKDRIIDENDIEEIASWYKQINL